MHANPMAHRLPTLTLTLTLLASMASLYAQQTVPGKKVYSSMKGQVSNAHEVCAALGGDERPTVVKAQDSGTSVSCKVRFKDGFVNEQHTGSISLECPDNARSVDDHARCECDSGFVASGSACKRPDEAAPSAQAHSAASAASATGNCRFDRLKGAALRSSVVSEIRRLTDESNRALIDAPKQSAQSVGPKVGRGFFTGDYGTIVENMVANRVKRDNCLGKYLRHLTAAEQSKSIAGEKASYPDFIGQGPLANLKLDITTREQQGKKLSTDGGKSDYVFIVYERGLCLHPETKLATKIPAGADRSLIKNGICPKRWK
jgi:hypothetical protein